MIKEIDSAIISEEIKVKMGEHACKAYPSECCGILFGKYEDDEIIKIIDLKKGSNLLDNSYGKNDKSVKYHDVPDPKRNYEISPLQIYRAEEEYKQKGFEIVGFYHSHPDKAAILSRKDEDGMIPGLIYAILSVTRNGCSEIRVWKKDNIE